MPFLGLVKSLKFNWCCRSEANNTRSTVASLMNDWDFNIGRPWRKNPLLVTLLTSASDSTHNFLALPGENNAKLVAEIIFEIDNTSVRIDMSCSLKHNF